MTFPVYCQVDKCIPNDETALHCYLVWASDVLKNHDKNSGTFNFYLEEQDYKQDQYHYHTLKK